ncbi:MAG: PAS domain S-box protein [Planctomycetes bacterium]|nr:PAS domain S-box protein [Planctomycetota bacterium]
MTDATGTPMHDRDRARLEALLEAAVDAIITIDTSGTILSCNPAAVRMFGFAADELLGTNVSILMPSPDRERHDDYLARFLATGEARVIGQRREATGRHKSGDVFPIELSVSQCVVDGEIWFTGIIHDISERKAVEHAEVLRKEIEAKVSARSEFLRHMSHEIRTPLTAILGFSEMLAERTDDVLVIEGIEVIRRNGEHLLHLVNDILDLEKLDADRIEPERIDTDLREIVHDLATIMRPLATRKNLTFETRVDDDVPRLIRSDPTRIRQILINLVGNAVKFTSRGRIRLDVSLRRSPESGEIAVSVLDTGVGVSCAEPSLLFEPFAQAERSTTREFGGSGLGLAISRRLARVLGGDVTVRENDEDGHGSIFTATFSADVAPSRPRSRPDATTLEGIDAGPNLNGLEILLVEDGADNRLLLGRILEQGGARVSIAENGEQALASVDERGVSNPFDAILMDMQMPVMDGIEATQSLRARGYSGPVVALTANATRADRDRCIAVGCDAFAGKPIRRRELLTLVADVARG